MSVRRPALPLRALSAVAAGVMLLSGCQLLESEGQRENAAGGDQEPRETTPDVALVSSVPATDVPVDAVVRLTAEGGSLAKVTVTDPKGAPLAGQLEPGGAAWVATSRLEPGQTYTVSAIANDADGGSAQRTQTFSTRALTLDEQTWADVAPLQGETVGVGMPVLVSFDVPVTDRATFERHMKVTSTPAQQGSWHWLSDKEAHWRPASYWQPGTKVVVDLDINSLPAGGGIYGQESRHVEFNVGDAHVYKVNADTYQMQVYSNGALIRTIPITTGKEGFVTRSGVKVIMEKFRRREMRSETIGIADENDPDYYSLDDVEYAMRLTYSGEFIHAAPWSVGSQGRANVSHGCTGMSTANAGWLFNMTRRGDVVEYVGTSRQMTLENGWGDWNLPFGEYAAGSAL